MQRRKFLLGAGSLAAAGAAAMGTGAFASVSAGRGMDVNVSSDSNAYLQIKGDPDYTTESNGTLQVDLQDNGQGSGINGNATTEFTDLLLVRNQGTENVLLWVDLNALNAQIGPNPGTTDGQYVSSYLSMDDYGAGMDGGGGTSATQGTSGAPGAWGVFLAPGKRAEIALGFYDVPEDDIGSMYDADIGINAASADSEFFKNVIPNYTFPSQGTPDIDFIE